MSSSSPWHARSATAKKATPLPLLRDPDDPAHAPAGFLEVWTRSARSAFAPRMSISLLSYRMGGFFLRQRTRHRSLVLSHQNVPFHAGAFSLLPLAMPPLHGEVVRYRVQYRAQPDAEALILPLLNAPLGANRKT